MEEMTNQEFNPQFSNRRILEKGDNVSISLLGSTWKVCLSDLNYDPYNSVSYSYIDAAKHTLMFDRRSFYESKNKEFCKEYLLTKVIEVYVIESGADLNPKWIAHNMDKINNTYKYLLPIFELN